MAPHPLNAVKSSNPNGQRGQEKEANPGSRPTFEDLLTFIKEDRSLTNVEATEEQLYRMRRRFNHFVNQEPEWGPTFFIIFLEHYLGTRERIKPWHSSLRIQLGSHNARVRAGKPSRSTSIEIPTMLQTEKMKNNSAYQSYIAISTGREIKESSEFSPPYNRSTSVQQEPVYVFTGGRERIAKEIDSTQQKILAQIVREVNVNLKKVVKPKVVKQSALQKIRKQRRTH